MPFDHVVTKHYEPSTRLQKTVKMTLYRIDKDDTRLASDPDLVEICSVTIPVSGVGKPKSERAVTVTLRLGKSRVAITATDDTSGESKESSEKWENVRG